MTIAIIYHKDMPQTDSGTKLDDFDRKILSYLLKEDWPVTTEMVADAIPSSWNTAQLHLYKVKSEGWLEESELEGRINGC